MRMPSITIDSTTLVCSNSTAEDTVDPKALDIIPPTVSTISGRKPGDTVITTSDGATFHVHFDILAFASPVFYTLLTPSALPDAYNINEQSDVFVCFTRLAYSRDVPLLTSFHALDNALHVASKYELTIMKRLLRTVLSDETSPLFLENDPISSFGIAIKHDFPKELAAASRLIIQHVSLRNAQTLQLLRSSTIGMRIMNMLAFRQSVLADMLLSKERGIVLIEDSTILAALSCQSCFASAETKQVKYAPWMSHWAQNAYEVLSSSCVTMQDKLFGVGCVLEMMSGSTSCAPCRCAIAANPVRYESWAQGIREKLKQKLVIELAA